MLVLDHGRVAVYVIRTDLNQLRVVYTIKHRVGYAKNMTLCFYFWHRCNKNKFYKIGGSSMCLKELIAFINFCENKPEKPVEPIGPIEPIEPEEPVEPIDPVEPIEPPDPIEPEPPTEPDPPQPEFVYEYVIFPARNN